VAGYPAATCASVVTDLRLSAAARIAVYNRQYWFRLLRSLHDQLPLTARLWGLWQFNQRAMEFLRAHPPRNHDLGCICEGFDRYLGELSGDLLPCPERRTLMPRAALLQAAQLDLAFRRVFLAPPQPRFQLAAGTDLGRARLQASAAHARIREDWPLVHTRSQLLGKDAPHVVALPEKLAHPRTWALFRTPRGVGQLALEPDFARLLELLATHTVGDALARLETEVAADAREALPGRVQRWMEQSAKLGFYSGVRLEQ